MTLEEFSTFFFFFNDIFDLFISDGLTDEDFQPVTSLLRCTNV